MLRHRSTVSQLGATGATISATLPRRKRRRHSRRAVRGEGSQRQWELAAQGESDPGSPADEARTRTGSRQTLRSVTRSQPAVRRLDPRRTRATSRRTKLAAAPGCLFARNPRLVRRLLAAYQAGRPRLALAMLQVRTIGHLSRRPVPRLEGPPPSRPPTASWSGGAWASSSAWASTWWLAWLSAWQLAWVSLWESVSASAWRSALASGP